LLVEVNAMVETTNERLIHPSVILVATNLSDLHRVMPFAIQMAERTGARLQLLHILQFGGEFTADAAGMPYFDRESAFSTAMNMLLPWCERVQQIGLRCEAVVREGHPAAHEIITAVRQLHADRLLLGTRSRGKFGKLLLGSVAEQVLRSANLPVYTIGPEAHLPSESNRQPTVLFATALGEGHHAGAALACQIAANQHGKLILLHVLPPPVEKTTQAGSNILYPTFMSELRHLAHSVGAAACRDVEAKVLYGNPADRILSEAAANHADLIVMQTNAHPNFHSILHGRTICKVLAHTSCPVLTLQHEQASSAKEKLSDSMWPELVCTDSESSSCQLSTDHAAGSKN
jgi:nucleotide-binding universal stress UspA family protein